MRRAPLVPVALALVGAMLAAHYLPALTPRCWLLLTATASLVGGAAMLWLRKSKTIVYLCILLLAAGVGGTLMRSADPRYDHRHWTHLTGPVAYLDVRLDETPQPRPRSYRVHASVHAIDGKHCRGTITLYLRPDSTAATLRYGDRLLLHARPDPSRASLYTTADHYTLLSHTSPTLRSRLESLRIHLLQRIHSGPLPRRHAAIAAAFTLGWRADIDPDTLNLYRDSGIMHLLCVSGLHVGLLASLVGLLLLWLGKERRGRIIRGTLQMLAVWTFTLLSGAAPATLRAALMFSLFILADSLGRRTDRLNLLALAAIVMLLSKPLLIFDLGWQLSVSAVAGIALIHPLLRHTLPPLSHALVSTAATIATLPLIVARFHRLPLYFLVANLLVVPLAALILATSLLYLLLPCPLTAWLVSILLSFSDIVTSWVSSLPLAVIDNLYPTPLHLVALTLAALSLLLTPRFLRSRTAATPS